MQASRRSSDRTSPRRGCRGGGFPWLLVAAAGLAAGCRGADPGSRPDSGLSLVTDGGRVPPPEDGADRALALHRLGERVETREFSLTVGAVKECPRPYLKEGNILLGVELVIEALAERDINVNPFYAQVADADGLRYRPTLQGCEPRLSAVRLAQGERARGFVTFELPSRARRLELRYEPATRRGERQVVSVDLDR